MIKKKTHIQIHVKLDENHVPEEIYWSAEDGGISDKSCKALMLSVWDNTKEETARMDLWTKEMPVEDMKKFFHQILISMGDTYHRATSDESTAREIRNFGQRFAEKTELIKSKML
ncbi:MAG: gliding motility protein GldC [Flavobacteriales bacterium AspAUS03]